MVETWPVFQPPPSLPHFALRIPIGPELNLNTVFTVKILTSMLLFCCSCLQNRFAHGERKCLLCICRFASVPRRILRLSIRSTDYQAPTNKCSKNPRKNQLIILTQETKPVADVSKQIWHRFCCLWCLLLEWQLQVPTCGNNAREHIQFSNHFSSLQHPEKEWSTKYKVYSVNLNRGGGVKLLSYCRFASFIPLILLIVQYLLALAPTRFVSVTFVLRIHLVKSGPRNYKLRDPLQRKKLCSPKFLFFSPR